MEEILKALSPWPVAQGIVIGLLVAAGGAWAMRRGFQDFKKSDAPPPGAQKVHIELTDEEKRLEWTAYEQLGNLEKNSFAQVRLLEKMTEAMNRLADGRWNARQ